MGVVLMLIIVLFAAEGMATAQGWGMFRSGLRWRWATNLAPQPRIFNPDDGVWRCGVVGIGVVEENDADDVLCTVFQFSRDGRRWRWIGIDLDGTAETVGCPVPDTGGDGWSALWDTSRVPEGWYYIRATMFDRWGKRGSDQVTVYVDPTPPVPTILTPLFDQEVAGTVTITASTEDEDVSGVIFSLFEVQTSSLLIEKDVPWTPQGYGCAPAACAASLLWLDQYTNEKGEKPFDDLVPDDVEDPEKLTEELNKKFKTDNVDPAGMIGTHLTSDRNMVAGVKEFVKDKGFVVKAIGQEQTGTWCDELPNGVNWIEYYKTMLPHEDITVCFEATKDDGTRWGHCVTANSFKPNYEIWWTPEGCIWAQVPPYTIDFMDHNAEEGTYREAEMDTSGNIKGLEKYYGDLQATGQKVDKMIVTSPKVAYDELEKALEDFSTLPSDWKPIGPGRPIPGTPDFGFSWDTTAVADGAYLLMATIIDSQGNEGSKMIWINVNNAGVNLFGPEAGEVVPANTVYTLEWLTTCEAVTFDLDYTLDGGATWVPMATSIPATSYDWTVPIPAATTDQCLVNVRGFDEHGEAIAVDMSASPFTIVVPAVTDGAGASTSFGTQ